MKKLILLIAAFFLMAAAHSQAVWTPVNSGLDAGAGIGQISVGMNNQDALWAMAIDFSGAILDSYTHSSDGGLTWTKGTFSAGATGLSQLFAIDENTCWAVFNTGATQGLYKTVNGGTSWVKKGGVFNASSFADVLHFFNDNEGFAMGDPVSNYFEIYTTTDGGETWVRVPQANIPAPVSGEYGITANYSASGNNVWFGTNKGRVFRSTDKGLHWAASLTTFGSAVTVATAFSDAMNGFAYRSYLDVGVGDSLSMTTDGGVTWTNHAVGGNMYARYVEYVKGTTGTFVGSTGTAGGTPGISYSYDGGLNWTQITENVDFEATAWLDVATGWAGSSAAKKSTGGMFIYEGDSLLPLAARFEADKVAVMLGEPVTFTNHSAGFPLSYLWTFEGGTPSTFSGATPPVVVYSMPGEYDVTLKVTNAYTDDQLIMPNMIYVGGVGVQEQDALRVAVYPNPVVDAMTIQAGSELSRLVIINPVGQTIATHEISGTKTVVNLGGLPGGVYTAKIILENGNTVNKKIVVR